MMRRLVLLLAAAALSAAQPVSLAVSQIWDSPPELLVALNPRGADGLPVRVDSPEITATIGGIPMVQRAGMGFLSTRHGVAYLLLTDVSKSLDEAHFRAVLQAREQLSEGLRQQDRMAVVSFGDEVRAESDFTGDRATLAAVFRRMKPAGGQTKLHLALARAFELGRRRDLPPRRAIVVLSDGKDEGSGLTMDDLLARPDSRYVPVYAIGSSRLPEPARKQSFDSLRRLAANTGGEFVEAGTDFAEGYERIRKSIVGVYLVGLTCHGCRDSSRAQPLEVRLKTGDKVLSASASWILPPETARGPLPVRDSLKRAAQPVPGRSWYPIAGGAALLFVVALVVAARKRRTQPLRESPSGQTAPTRQRAVAPPRETPAPLALRLVVVRGQKPGAEHNLRLEDESIIGTGADCQLLLCGEPALGHRQFALSQSNGRILVRDLNGNTSLNGVPLHEAYPVRDGDIIGATGVELRLLVKTR